jgi:hypothetical protein
MRFEQCPYCQRPVEVMHFPGGWLRIACHECGAQWEAHSGMVRRIADGELLDSSADEVRASARSRRRGDDAPPAKE